MKRVFLILLLFLGGHASAQLVLPICSAPSACPGFPLGSVQAPVDQNGWRNFKITLTQNVTSFSFVGIPPSPAQAAVNVIFTEDAIGGRTVTFASSITNPCTITTTASATTLCQFEYDGVAGQWFGISSGGASLPAAGGAGYFPVSTAAGTNYTGSITPSINGAINQTGVTIGGSSYFGEAHGDNSFPDKICGITAAGAYPPSPATGYGYAAIDVCPALFTAPAPTVVGTTSRSIMGINSAIATQFPDFFNVFAINGQLASPTSSTTNQHAWYGVYHESDWNNTSGTLAVSYGMFGANYNSGSGTCTSCVAGHFEAVGNFYNRAVTPLTSSNIGLECNSGVLAGGTHTNDTCFHVMTPFTGGTFTNSHIGIQIDDQTAGGVIGGALAIRNGTGNSAAVGNLDWGTATQFIESTGTGFLTLQHPSGTYGSVIVNWPASSGNILTSPCTTTKVFLNADFTSANTAGLQAITGLSCALAAFGGVVPNTSFTCEVMYSQATNVAGDQFGVIYTGSLTNFNAWGSVATNTGAATPFTTGTATGIASNTATSVVTFQPGNTGLNIATIKGTIEPSAQGTFQLYVTNGTAADVIVVKRDSYCQLF